MKKYLILVLITVAVFTSCNNEVAEVVNDIKSNNIELEDVVANVKSHENINNNEEDEKVIMAEEQTEESIEEQIEEVVEEPVNFEELYEENKVNELGQIMVIMYHNLADKPGEYATTKDLFIRDLERLYNEGYRTISMSDLIFNNISIPMGTTPVILTFDDASKSNFYYNEDGSIGENSVVSILDEFGKNHEDFGKNAVFYIYGENSFRNKDNLKEKLEYLVSNGYEIGNHTYGHDNLKKLSIDSIQRVLGKNEKLVDSLINDYDMIHLSLPYGARPSESKLPYVYKGEYEDTIYEIKSVVNVGWNPISSPSHSNFNPVSINRITCGEDDFELTYWMDYFKENPHKRYYSDGNAENIVIKESQKEYVKEIYIDRVITYPDLESE